MHETKIEMKLEEETKKLSEMCERLVDSAKQQLDSGIQNIDTEEFGKVIDAIKDLCDAKEKIAKKCYYASILKAMEKAEDEDKEQEKYMLQMLKEQYGEDEGKRFYDNYRYANGRFAPTGRGTYHPRSYGRSRRGYDDMGYMMMPEMYDREWNRDMDRESQNRMYYSGGGNSGNSSGSNSGRNSGGSYGGNSGGMSGNNSGNSSRGYSDGYSDGEQSGYHRGYSEGERNGRNSQRRDSREGRSGRSRRSYMEKKEMSNGDSPEEKKERTKELEKYMNELSGDITDMISDASNEERTVLKAKLSTLLQKI